MQPVKAPDGCGVAILPAERDAAAGERLADRGEQGRTADRPADRSACGALRPLGDAARQRQAVGAGRRSSSSCRRQAFSFRHFHSPGAARRRRREVATPPGRLYVRCSRSHRGSPRSTDRDRSNPATSSMRAMMQAIRGKAGSIVIKVLFGLLIVSFALWGIYTRSDYLPELARDGRRHGRRPQHPRRRVAAANCSRSLERLRAQFGGSDRPAAAEAARHRRFGARPADRPQPARPGGAAARPRSFGRRDPQRDLREPGLPRARRQVRPAAVRAGADDEPAQRGPAGGAAAARHPARRPAAGGHRRGRRDPPGGRRALPLSQRKAGRRHRRLSGRRRSPISASRARQS